jgi:hypothetical protein
MLNKKLLNKNLKFDSEDLALVIFNFFISSLTVVLLEPILVLKLFVFIKLSDIDGFSDSLT